MGTPHTADLTTVSGRWRSGYDITSNIAVVRNHAEELIQTPLGDVSTDMNMYMTSHFRQHLLRAAVVAATITGLAAFSAWVLASVVHLPEPVVVLTVMVCSFMASWLVTNHRAVHHRVTLVPVHPRTH